ncbi:restriction endonuclease [Agrococcus jejuensis]|uniref:Restriction endonuclease n=1 Tax=Agrococcus jejuensis TaxID=399736 RepID=A0A1G8AAN7_9MICO|nr:restriction endonuclease [Agrococcus jejuensis]SDH18095.1 Restriction endonuclease [Agrococcus jejuensis]
MNAASDDDASTAPLSERARRISELRGRLGLADGDGWPMSRAAEASKEVDSQVSARLAELLELAGVTDMTPKFAVDYFERLVGALVRRWPSHGGQGIPPAVAELLARAGRVVFSSARPHHQQWDLRLDDGTIHRFPTWQHLADNFVAVYRGHLNEQTTALWTYDVHAPWTSDELDAIALQSATECLSAERRRLELLATLALASESLASWQRLHPAPAVCPYGASAVGAEYWCRDWLIHMGLPEARTTAFSGDGGIDVDSPSHIAQVKHYVGAVGIAEIRELAGVALVDGRAPIFMTSGIYPAEAEAFADAAQMALLHYNVESGVVDGVNRLGKEIVSTGLLPVLAE